MTIFDAQAELRRAYVGGGPGVFISGLAWAVASWVAADKGVAPAFVTLFIGGMLISPLNDLACRWLFGRRRLAKGNPLVGVALESTVVLIAGLLVAWQFFSVNPTLVLPAAAIAVGTRYTLFRSLYGNRLYWLLAALIAGVGFAWLFYAPRLPGGPAAYVAAIELLFGTMLTYQALQPTSGKTMEHRSPA